MYIISPLDWERRDVCVGVYLERAGGKKSKTYNWPRGTLEKGKIRKIEIIKKTITTAECLTGVQAMCPCSDSGGFSGAARSIITAVTIH